MVKNENKTEEVRHINLRNRGRNEKKGHLPICRLVSFFCG